MRVLIACEFSGIVRDAFAALGHEAWSCDLLPSERSGNHIQGDVLEILDRDWDLMVAHPPCTYLAVSGARWWMERQQEQEDAIRFVEALWSSPIDRIAIENPVGILSKRFLKPDQIIQPYYFGHSTSKATCLWLWKLPGLHWTNEICLTKVRDDIHQMPPSPDRQKNRSRTFSGIAAAMADQWGRL